MPLHSNINSFPGNPYSLFDNLWVFTAPTEVGDTNAGYGVFIAPRTGWYLLTGCGGGGGGGSGTTFIMGGGGAAAGVYRMPVWLVAGESYNITVGQKGARGASFVGSNGAPGGGTSFGSSLIIGGGGGGQGLSPWAGGGAGGIMGTFSGAATSFSLTANAGQNGSNHASPGNGNGGGPGFDMLRFDILGIPNTLSLPADGTPGVTPAPPANGVSGVGLGVGGSGCASNSGVGYYGGYGTPGILIIEMPA